MARLVLVGGGEHCRVVIEAIRAAGEHEIVGVLDAKKPAGTLVGDVEILGSDRDLESMRARGAEGAVVTVGSVGDPAVRVRVADTVRAAGYTTPAIVHPRAYIAHGAQVAQGAFVAAGAVIGVDARVGEFAIVNTCAAIDHDCRVGEFAHVAPGCALSGMVVVGERTHLGTGVSVVHGIEIGSDTVVGAGAVVVSDIPDSVVAYGNPCRIVRERS